MAGSVTESVVKVENRKIMANQAKFLQAHLETFSLSKMGCYQKVYSYITQIFLLLLFMTWKIQTSEQTVKEKSEREDTAAVQLRDCTSELVIEMMKSSQVLNKLQS